MGNRWWCYGSLHNDIPLAAVSKTSSRVSLCALSFLHNYPDQHCIPNVHFGVHLNTMASIIKLLWYRLGIKAVDLRRHGLSRLNLSGHGLSRLDLSGHSLSRLGRLGIGRLGR